MTTTRLPGPEMTEIVNPRIGAIRVAGRLTSQGGDLLRGTVESLRRSGHTRVLVDLAQLQSADAEAVQLLRDVDRELAADGGALLLRGAPAWWDAEGDWNGPPRSEARPERARGEGNGVFHSSSVR